MSDKRLATVPFAALEALREDVAQFHTAKALRAWASEENQLTKRSALARIDALIAYARAADTLKR